MTDTQIHSHADSRTDSRTDAYASGLSHTRTVDRALVHRDSLGEVFLTDLLALDGETYAVAAQLPRSHAYYGDHLLRPGMYDPMLLLESSRQAGLAAAHAFFGVPSDHKFILTRLRVQLTHPERIVVGPAPFPLTMRVAVVDRRERDGLTTGVDSVHELFLNGLPIGRAEVGLRFKSPTSYLKLRLANRDGKALPSSATHLGGPTGAPLAPYLVGRGNPDNVVLVAATTHGDTARAVLRVPTGHPSMFDHPQDHLPGMVIAEGARQLALLAALDARGMSTAKVLPTDLEVTFTRFGELEQETVLTATVGEPYRADAAGPEAYYTQGGVVEPDAGADTPVTRLPVRVEAVQEGESLCVFSFTLTQVRDPR
jgi:hypothetical protein